MAPRHLIRLALLALVALAVVPAGAAAQDTTPVTLTAPEQDAFTRINAYRTSLGLRPVRLDPVLQEEAEWYADDMATNDNFNHDHRDSLGRLPASRLASFDYKYPDLAAENSAAGYPDGASTFEQWRLSPPHERTMREPTYRTIGIAVAYREGTSSGWYWVSTYGPDPNRSRESIEDEQAADDGDGLTSVTVRVPLLPHVVVKSCSTEELGTHERCVHVTATPVGPRRSCRSSDEAPGRGRDPHSQPANRRSSASSEGSLGCGCSRTTRTTAGRHAAPGGSSAHDPRTRSEVGGLHVHHQKLRARITSAHVIAMIALFVALSGSSYAAVTIRAPRSGTTRSRGSKLKSGSIPATKLRNNSITGGKLKNNSVGAAKLRTDALTPTSGGGNLINPNSQDTSSNSSSGTLRGPQGPSGPAWTTGAPGAKGDTGATGSRAHRAPSPAFAVRVSDRDRDRRCRWRRCSTTGCGAGQVLYATNYTTSTVATTAQATTTGTQYTVTITAGGRHRAECLRSVRPGEPPRLNGGPRRSAKASRCH